MVQLLYHIMLMLLSLSGSDSRHTVIADAVLLRFLVCIDGDHACAGRPAASAIEFMINCTSKCGFTMPWIFANIEVSSKQVILKGYSFGGVLRYA